MDEMSPSSIACEMISTMLSNLLLAGSLITSCFSCFMVNIRPVSSRIVILLNCFTFFANLSRTSISSSKYGKISVDFLSDIFVALLVLRREGNYIWIDFTCFVI